MLIAVAKLSPREPANTVTLGGNQSWVFRGNAAKDT